MIPRELSLYFRVVGTHWYLGSEDPLVIQSLGYHQEEFQSQESHPQVQFCVDQPTLDDYKGAGSLAGVEARFKPKQLFSLGGTSCT